MNFEDFRANLKTVAAVERMLLTISEAAKRLGPAAETLCPGQPWHKIRGTGTGFAINMTASIFKASGIR